MHSQRYIYPNNVIGPAPLAGGSVTGPPSGPPVCVCVCESETEALPSALK